MFFFNYLFLLAVPHILPFSFGNTPILAGETAEVVCAVAEGDKPFKIIWKFNGSKNMEDLGITFFKAGMRSSILFIESIKLEHRGKYTCIVKNSAGSDEYSAYLNIHGIVLSLKW